MAASAPFAAIRPAYAPAPLLTAADVPASARRFDVDYGGVMRLLAFEVGKERVQPGDALPVTLYWQALAPTSEDFSIYLQLFGWQQQLGQRDSYPGGGTRPTSRLAPGQVVADTYLIPVRPDAKGPAPAWISAGLYRLSSQEKLPATDSAGQAGRLSDPDQARPGCARADADRRASAGCQSGRPRAADRLRSGERPLGGRPHPGRPGDDGDALLAGDRAARC